MSEKTSSLSPAVQNEIFKGTKGMSDKLVSALIEEAESLREMGMEDAKIIHEIRASILDDLELCKFLENSEKGREEDLMRKNYRSPIGSGFIKKSHTSRTENRDPMELDDDE